MGGIYTFDTVDGSVASLQAYRFGFRILVGTRAFPCSQNVRIGCEFQQAPWSFVSLEYVMWIKSWNREVEGSGVPRGWVVQPPPPPKFRGFDKAAPNSQFGGKYIRNNLIRIRTSPICKLSGTPDKVLPPPNPRFFFPLSSTEFVEPPPPKKFLGTPLVEGGVWTCAIGGHSYAIQFKSLISRNH
jgi:hypothetical protein